MTDTNETGERLVRSRQRVSDHGEVFTPAWLVKDMLDLVKDETERIDARFLEPACGSGNFLLPVLERKLSAVGVRYARSDFERLHNGLFALMCVYGIELLADNATECRVRLLEVFTQFVASDALWTQVGARVLGLNIVQGDALSMTDAAGGPIVFAEWAYLGKGKFQRRDFRYDRLTERSAWSVGLLADLDDHEIFVPVRTYPPMTIQELAA